MKKLTDSKYWSKNFSKSQIYQAYGTPYDFILEKYLPKGEEFKMLEIGAYPGGNATAFKKKYRYSVTALDYVEETPKMQDFFDFNNVEIDIIKADFLKWSEKAENQNKYDIAVSFGFIEHFDNYGEILEKHLKTLKKGGYLVFTVPSLGFMQLNIRRLLYTPEKLSEVLKIHNLEAMNLKNLKDKLTGKVEFEFSEYIRNMTIWFKPNPETIRMNRIWLYNFFVFISKIIKKLGINNRFWSPEILIIARKK